MSAFSRYIGIDYSGAETPEASLKGLRVYCAVGESAANEVPPPPSPRKYWTRRGIAHWLAARLAENVPTIVGIDHGFSFPLRYFEVHQLAPDWPTFLEDFQRHWPTDAEQAAAPPVRRSDRAALRATAMRARSSAPSPNARRGPSTRTQAELFGGKSDGKFGVRRESLVLSGAYTCWRQMSGSEGSPRFIVFRCSPRCRVEIPGGCGSNTAYLHERTTLSFQK
jgi:hypothetical protein